MPKLAAAVATALFALSAPAIAQDPKKEEKKSEAKKDERKDEKKEKKAKGGC
ncbi:MAG: hypothetical protein ING52_07250 [Burkholderiales bacterium]|jgi:ribosomal protein L12E/L44/L45/RPP1/RPP2|nr:hypothetical protein [Burkholderiales bacterium]MCA3215719.1 hypothetical protein [Burkholderiales bacterium]MCA3225292.1 hypothetical protein [Burkholderiales bacterium]